MHALNVTYFDSFGVEHIQKEITNVIERFTITNIFSTQKYDSKAKAKAKLSLLIFFFPNNKKNVIIL